MVVVPPHSSPPVPLAGQLLSNLTPLEQALDAELAYYRQFNRLAVTAADEAAWQQSRAVYDLLRPPAGARPGPCLLFVRFVLERHGHSLHRYMARHLSPQSWACWFGQRGFLAPF